MARAFPEQKHQRNTSEADQAEHSKIIHKRPELGLLQNARVEELLGLRPAHGRSGGAKVVPLQPQQLRDAPFLLYPPRSNMRLSIDTFFQQLGITPRVIMEADDTEAIKRLVESGFGYSMLPEFSLRGQSRFLELFRVAGHRLVRRQALAMPRTEYPRALTQSIAREIHAALVRS